MNENHYMNYWANKLERSQEKLSEMEFELIKDRFDETMAKTVEQFQQERINKHQALAILDNLEEMNDDYKGLVSLSIYKTIDTLISIYTEIIYRINAKKENI